MQVVAPSGLCHACIPPLAVASRMVQPELPVQEQVLVQAILDVDVYLTVARSLMVGD